MKKVIKILKKKISEDCHCITYDILRIFLPLILWAKWASVFRFFNTNDTVFLLTGIIFYISSLFMFIGLYSRVANILLAICCLWIYYGLGVNGSYYDFVHHHTYLLCIAIWILMWAPTGKLFSVDKYNQDSDINENDNHRLNLLAPKWPLLLICFQVSMVYFWGAYDKLTPLFLSGGALDYIFFDLYRLHIDLFTSPEIKFFYSFLGAFVVLIEFFLALGLWFKKTRVIACIVGFIVHASFYMLLPVSTFSATMVLLYLSYFPPEEVALFVKKIGETNSS